MVQQRTRMSGRARAVLVVLLMLAGVVLTSVGDEDASGFVGYLDSLGTGMLIGCGTGLAVLLWRGQVQQ